MTAVNQSERLVDQFRIQELSGSDHFSEHFAAYEIETGKSIRFSVLKQEFAADEHFLQEYLHRAHTLLQVRHPNLPAYVQAGLVGDSRPYVAVEAVDSYPLSERLSRLGQEASTPQRMYTLSLVRQLASGLELLERFELFHHELTPEYILVRSVTVKSEESVIVSGIEIPHDFLAASEATGDDALGYLSPEQRAGKEIDGRSHVYTLGVLLHEMLSSERPQQPISLWSKGKALLTGTTDFAKLRPDLAPETHELVTRSLSKSPRRRYGGIAAFQAALSRSISAEEAAMHSKWAENNRRPRRVFLIPLILLLLCGILGATLLRFMPGDSGQTVSAAVPVSQESAALVAAETPSPSSTALQEQQPTSTRAASPTAIPTIDSAAIVADNNMRPTQTATSLASLEATDTDTPEITATAVPSTTPTATSAPTNTPLPNFRVGVSSANIRVGPGTNYDVLGFVMQSEDLEIIARTTGNFSWYNVRTEDGRVGWIAGDVGEVTWPPEPERLQTPATIPPSPTPTPTPTSTPTPIPPTASPQPSGGGSGSGGGDGSGGGGGEPRATPTPPL